MRPVTQGSPLQGPPGSDGKNREMDTNRQVPDALNSPLRKPRVGSAHYRSLSLRVKGRGLSGARRKSLHGCSVLPGLRGRGSGEDRVRPGTGSTPHLRCWGGVGDQGSQGGTGFCGTRGSRGRGQGTLGSGGTRRRVKTPEEYRPRVHGADTERPVRLRDGPRLFCRGRSVTGVSRLGLSTSLLRHLLPVSLDSPSPSTRLQTHVPYGNR